MKIIIIFYFSFQRKSMENITTYLPENVIKTDIGDVTVNDTANGTADVMAKVTADVKAKNMANDPGRRAGGKKSAPRTEDIKANSTFDRENI